MSNAAIFWYEIRRWKWGFKPFENSGVLYEIKPDEKLDATLVSERVYGRRDEYLVICAITDTDRVDNPVHAGRYWFPADEALFGIKRRIGFETRADLIDEEGKPVWQR